MQHPSNPKKVIAEEEIMSHQNKTLLQSVNNVALVLHTTRQNFAEPLGNSNR